MIRSYIKLNRKNNINIVNTRLLVVMTIMTMMHNEVLCQTVHESENIMNREIFLSVFQYIASQYYTKKF